MHALHIILLFFLCLVLCGTSKKIRYQFASCKLKRGVGVLIIIQSKLILSTLYVGIWKKNQNRQNGCHI